MNFKSGQHDQEHLDLVLLHLLQALPASEIAVVEAQISGCAECRREIEALRPITESFISWPTDVLRPSAPLWGRVAERIAPETGTPPFSPAFRVSSRPEWEEPAPGISCQLLATDTERQRVSMLVRLAPGAEYPPHRHQGVEELHLLHGELMIDARKLYPGDYIRSEPDTVDHRVWTETGCTCVLLTSINDIVL
ncbi:MAG TPA: cupin domain-containing protein [Bryobacteraceae bacterium]|nr:cupin domain-containing protein [Bryobacteraceae bacterium]